MLSQNFRFRLTPVFFLCGSLLFSGCGLVRSLISPKPKRPFLSSAYPSEGSVNGGTRITFFGNDIESGAQIQINENPCRVEEVSNHKITCISPSGDLGYANVKIKNPNGESAEFPFLYRYGETPSTRRWSFPNPRQSERMSTPRPTPPPTTPPLPRVNPFARRHSEVERNRELRAPVIREIFEMTLLLRPSETPLFSFYVLGENFEAGAQIRILRNGNELGFTTTTNRLSPFLIQCIVMGFEPHEPFEIYVLNPAPSHLRSGIATIRATVQPVPVQPNSQANPSVTAREFPQPTTEVELLSHGLHERIQTNRFINSVDFQGEQIDIYTTLNPASQSQHGPSDRYTLLDPEVASQLELEQNVTYTGAELLEQFEERDSSVWEILNQAIRAGRATQQSSSPDPFAMREVTPDQQRQITRIRNEIQTRLLELNREHQSPFYVTPSHQTRSGIAIHTFLEDREVFLSLVNAILDRQEAEFITQLLKLATFFNLQNRAARHEIIEVFSHLYVMQSFPSRGLMVNYFHYLLRCGQMNSSSSIF